jgi:hypothetical protein
MGNCVGSRRMVAEAEPDKCIPPARQFDERRRPIRGPKYDLDRPTLLWALQLMAGYIVEQKETLKVVVIGGAVNTLIDQDRPATHDVNFIGTNLNNNQRVLLGKAAKYAQSRIMRPLGDAWFNNDTTIFIDHLIHRNITQAAIAEHFEVFPRDFYRPKGLTLVAVPWPFALSSKMKMLADGIRRPIDWMDAAVCPQGFIAQNDGPIPVRMMRQWARTFYSLMPTDEVIDGIEKAYRLRYQRTGIGDTIKFYGSGGLGGSI